MKEKEYNIKFKKVSENEIVVSAKNKKDAMNILRRNAMNTHTKNLLRLFDRHLIFNRI